ALTAHAPWSCIAGAPRYSTILSWRLLSTATCEALGIALPGAQPDNPVGRQSVARCHRSQRAFCAWSHNSIASLSQRWNATNGRDERARCGLTLKSRRSTAEKRERHTSCSVSARNCFLYSWASGPRDTDS